MLPDQCIVIRDGSHTAISAIDLVPGDIVVIKQGNKLPADVRFVEASSDAMFDRAILTGKDEPPTSICAHTNTTCTGESEPIIATVDSTEENYLETNNIGLQGTHC